MRTGNNNDSITIINNNHNNNNNDIYDNNRSNWPFLDVVRMEIYHERKEIIYIIDCSYDQSGPFEQYYPLR